MSYLNFRAFKPLFSSVQVLTLEERAIYSFFDKTLSLEEIKKESNDILVLVLDAIMHKAAAKVKEVASFVDAFKSFESSKKVTFRLREFFQKEPSDRVEFLDRLVMLGKLLVVEGGIVLEDVFALNYFFGNLTSGGNAYIISDHASPNCSWHIYYATEKPEVPMVTLVMCMTAPSSEKASIFFNNSEDLHTKTMTKQSGIPNIIPKMEICDFEFEPCGYSIKAICGPALSTIHVTPEDGFIYASYELVGFDPLKLGFDGLVERLLSCFGPTDFSIAVTIFGSYGQAGT